MRDKTTSGQLGVRSWPLLRPRAMFAFPPLLAAERTSVGLAA
jgi:hypothetical protein